MFPPGKRYYKRFESLLQPQYSISEEDFGDENDAGEEQEDDEKETLPKAKKQKKQK
jgi:hypothetical protein